MTHSTERHVIQGLNVYPSQLPPQQPSHSNCFMMAAIGLLIMATLSMFLPVPDAIHVEAVVVGVIFMGLGAMCLGLSGAMSTIVD